MIYRLFGKSIQKQLAENAMRPPGFGGMTFAFSGADGMDYYSWEDLSDMPPVRQKHIERCLRMADAGIGEKTLNDLCDIADVANMDAMKASKPEDRAKKHAKVAQVIGEIRRRPKEIIPEEVYYDLAACFAIRRDEDPRKFDPVIHTQKIKMLTDAGKRGLEFFTAPSAFKKLLGYLLTSEAASMELLSGWTETRMRIKAVKEVHARS